MNPLHKDKDLLEIREIARSMSLKADLKSSLMKEVQNNSNHLM